MKINPTDIIMPPKFVLALLFLLYLPFLLGSLIGTGSITTAQDSDSNVSFETPEEAVTFYIQAVAAGEVPEIMQALAIDEMSENFSFDVHVGRLRLLQLHSPAPSDYALYRAINKAELSSQILFQTRNLAYGLLVPEKIGEMADGRILFIEETTEFVNEFINEVNPERLAQLQIVTIAVPLPDLAQDERTLENWARSAQMYGADELTERVVLLLFEENYYYTGFTLLRYGEDWKISLAMSALGYTNSFGFPVQTTEEEFGELIGGN